MDKALPEQLMTQVMANPKYQSITQDLVRRLCQEAITAGLTGKPAVKFVRNKLHQVGGAYFKKQVDYQDAAQQLADLPNILNTDATKDYCRNLMRSHSSTAERLPILEAFFQTSLASIAPITSVTDLACGLNPLAIPWMPLADDVQYHACDIYIDMLGLIEKFFGHFNISSTSKPCDLITNIPAEKTQVAFLLKSAPCLEQMDKSILIRLMEDIQAEHVLVSFPVHSLGGRQKGMQGFYRDRFISLLAEKPWGIEEFQFKTELAFLVSK